ncbi:MAG: ABC1 kinase family protein [Alphaproteobacteria bacterium]|jgi:predicted unusual protein kinase regulating ubiquinone biosynthesis (AarF/ABC1/UbiB family)|nr:AarF/ABC1/UbiB kinase family protein [Alphaproteobacteria bacterium]
MREPGDLTTKMKRYAKVSGALTKTAARLAGEKVLGIDIDHDVQSQEFALLMGSLKGPLMKVAQFLSTVPDALPDVYTRDFTALQSQAPAMGWSFVKRRMASELGAQWRELFQHFEEQACAAASLGQVHKAVLLDGSVAACKLQYPNMSASLEADLTQLRFAFNLYEKTLGGLKTEEILAEISHHLRQELDYTQEARHMRAFFKIFEKSGEIHIPVPHDALSTRRLLTMSWLEGVPLKECLTLPQDVRNLLAKRLFYAWYYPLYTYGILHGDPHLGNYTVTPNQTLNLLDFGCVRVFDPAFVTNILALYDALRTGDRDKEASAYEAWGFGTLSHALIDALHLWAEMLYEPILDDRVRPIQEGNRGHEGRERAAQVHKALRELGGVRPPREFVFLDRAAVGIGSAFMHLKAELNWHEAFHTLIDGFDPAVVRTRQTHLDLWPSPSINA